MMQHPIHEQGDRRRCPITGKLFGESWSNTAIRPFISFNVCDSCEPHSRDVTISVWNGKNYELDIPVDEKKLQIPFDKDE